LRRIAANVHDTRTKARNKRSGKRLSGELRRVVRKLEKVAHHLEQSEQGHAGVPAWRWVIAARVARRAATLKNAIDAAGAVYLAERLHAVRIAVKKLRYGLELATEAAGTAGGDDLRTLKRVQTNLGRMHDLQVLIDRVRHVQTSLAASDLAASKDLDRLMITLDATCRRLHGRYVRDRENVLEICRRLAVRIPPQSKIAKAAGVRRAG
jgi:CHAD domain-containing protein